MPDDLSRTEAAIYESLELDPLPIDEVVDTQGEDGPTSGEVMAALLQLELRGLVRQEPGKRFRRAR